MPRILATVVLAIAFIAGLTGCTRTVIVHDSPTASPPPAPAVVVDSPSPSPSFDYSTAGITIELKVTSKQCFGSAGCNLTVKPVLSVLDPASIPADASGEVTYQITGDTSGPVIETLTLTGGQYAGSESVLSTSGSDVKPSVKVTDITTN